ncbi:MAG: hypothetical protein GY696_21525 [Gammaproteobacteria bacterium]|nr:hypothetical protein [Gammaproteobacteria bacterium]
MPNSAGTLEIISRELGLILAPLETRVSDDGIEALIESLGLRLPPGLSAVSTFAGELSGMAVAAAALPGQVSTLVTAIDTDDVGQIITSGQTLSTTIIQVVQNLSSVGGALNSVGSSFAGLTPADRTQIQAFSQALPDRLLNLLLVEYIEKKSPQMLQGLRLAGIVEITVVTGNLLNPMLPDYQRKAVHFDRLMTLLTDPETHLQNIYGWGDPGFDGVGLFTILKSFFEQGLELPAELLQPAGLPATLEAYLLSLQVTRDIPPGLQLDFRFPATQDFNHTYPLGESWELELDARARFVADLSASLQPPLTIQFSPPSGDGQIDLTMGLGRQATAGPLVLFGKAGGSRLEVGDIRGGMGLSASWVGGVGGAATTVAPVIEAELVDGKLIINGEGGDSLIDEVLGAIDIESNFALAFRWSPGGGLQIQGSAGLDVDIASHAQIGPIRLDAIHLGLGLVDESIRIDLGSTIGAELGPLLATVERLGLRGVISFPEGGGNLGPARLDLDFLPPRGIALAMDTPTVKLGGFLSIDPDNHRYAGAVELSIADAFDLTAIGLITTRFPDGSDGFSMLFIISTRFPTPIHIAYNFYLSGVGGLLGLHRSVDIDRLRNGLQQGAVDDILFPEDVVRNMNALVTDLREIFPATRDQFLVGPMAEITWNTPALITAEVGLIIEFANPVRIAILGVIRVAVPTPDEAIVDLKVNFLGTIDFDRGLLTFDASIYDSYIGYGSFRFSFEGDIALRISWGEKPDFLTSVGGFHPTYNPPQHLALPPMKRLTLSLLKDNPRLTLRCYFALTTNTVQFGAELDFYFGVSGFKVVGNFGFDVLFQFVPFRFIAAVRASLAVKAGSTTILSLGLSFELAGTSPWSAKGSASFRILFIKVKVKFSKTWGERKEISLPRIDVLPELIDEFNRDTNWNAALSDLAGQQAKLLPASQAADSLLFDPAGMLTMSQNLIPLATTFSRFGNNTVADITLADVAEVRVGSKLLDLESTTEQFAPAAFQEMEDADKLKAGSYEPQKSGVTAKGGDRLHTDHLLTRPVRHEQIVSDADTVVSPLHLVDGNATLFNRLVPGGAIGKSPLSQKHVRQKQKLSVLDVGADIERFAVVTAANLQSTDAESVALTRSEAEGRVQQLVDAGADPSEFDIVPAFQMAG